VLKPAPEGVVIEGERSVKTRRPKIVLLFSDSQSDRVELYHQADFRAEPGRAQLTLPIEQLWARTTISNSPAF
jgi:hypothetical protein